MLKLASMKNSDLLMIKAAQVKARITVDEPAKLSTKNVKLALRFEYSGEGEREYQFVLQLLNMSEKIESGFWLSNPITRHEYDFKVADNSLGEFRKYQREFVKYGKPKKYYWTVYYYLEKRPVKGEPVNLDLELKLSKADDYFYLLKGVELGVN